MRHSTVQLLSSTARRTAVVAAAFGLGVPAVGLACEGNTATDCDGNTEFIDFSDDHAASCSSYIDVSAFGSEQLDVSGGQACGEVQQVNMVSVIDGVTTATVEFDFTAETDEDFEAGALLAGPSDDIYANIITAGFDGGHNTPLFNIKNLLGSGHVATSDVALSTNTTYHLAVTFTSDGDVTATVSQDGTVLDTLTGNVGPIEIGSLGAIAGRSPGSGDGEPLDGTYTCIDNLEITTDGAAPSCDGGGAATRTEPGFTISGVVAETVFDTAFNVLCEDATGTVEIDWDLSAVATWNNRTVYARSVDWEPPYGTATVTLDFDDPACGGPYINTPSHGGTFLGLSDGTTGGGVGISAFTGDFKTLISVESSEHGDVAVKDSGDLSWSGPLQFESNSYGQWQSTYNTVDAVIWWDTSVTATVDYVAGGGGGSSTDGDGVCDATDTVIDNTNGIADDCDLDDDGVHLDDDCDDDDLTVGAAGTWYDDLDGDGLGDPATAQSACDQPTGTVSNGDDVVGDDDHDNDGTADADDVCEGIADVDEDSDGITDCLEETLTLTADQSHVRWFDTKTGKARVDGTRVTYDKNKSWATFTGQMELGGGLLAPDFRDASDNGNGQVSVRIGGVSVYDETLQYDVHDFCSSSTSDNREKWQHKDIYVNEYGKSPYSRERAVLRFKNTMRYRSWQESGYPEMSDTDNYGRVHSRFISADESRVRVRWNRHTDLPLTVSLNGVDLVTITDNGDNTYTVDGSDYTVETVFRSNCTERKRVIDIVYPDNLQEGDVFTWTDGDGTELHSQTLEELDTSTSNTDSVWYNAGGRFHLRVPFGESVIDGLLDEDTASQTASVTIQIGNADSEGVVEGTTDYAYDVVTSGHWRVAEVDEDDSASSGGGGQGGNQSGSTCQANASDDPEP